MKISTMMALIGAALMASAAIATPTATQAVPLTTPYQLSQASEGNGLFEQVARNRYKRPAWRYNYRNHGPRYGYRYGRYRYHYGGYYYAQPYWAYASPFWIAPRYYGPSYNEYDGYYDDDYGGDYEGGYGDAHVRWCQSRYRSYDVRTDTYMGYDGYRRRCRGPY